MLAALAEDALLILTADHGTDPTVPSTDHTRERVPLLVVGEPVIPGTDLGTRDTYADIGATICELFGAAAPPDGRSFVAEMMAGAS